MASITIIDFHFNTGFLKTYHCQLLTSNSIELQPTIIFLHGLGARYSFYSWFLQWLPSIGVTCVAVNVPFFGMVPSIQWWVDGFSGCINELWLRNDLNQYVDLDRIGIAGHSMGGLGVVIASETCEDFMKCAMPMAPALFDFLGTPKPENINVPSLFIQGEYDKLVKANSVVRFVQEMTCEKKLVLEPSNHMQFMDESMSNIASTIFRSQSDLTVEGFHDVIKVNVSDWVDRWLRC